jgi:hypothetical protein
VLRLMDRNGGAFIIGRVKRDESSVQERVKLELKRDLRAAGSTALDGEANQGALIERLVRHGAKRLEPLVAGSWSRPTTPGQVIAGWESRSGLAGLNLARSRKAGHLAAVRTWATETYGSLDVSVTVSEYYVLSGVRLPPACTRVFHDEHQHRAGF